MKIKKEKDEAGHWNKYLFAAAHSGASGRVRLALSMGAIVNSKHAGEPVLHAAAVGGSDICVRLLLEAGADLEAVGVYKETAFLEACKRGKLECAKELLKAGARIDVMDCEGNSAMRWAAWKGENHILELLIEHGADIDETDSAGVTILMCAAGQGHLAAVKTLVKAGALAFQVDEKGLSAHGYAKKMDRSAISAYLSAASCAKRERESLEKEMGRRSKGEELKETTTKRASL